MILNDIYCLDSGDPFFTGVGGTLALGQAVARRLMSPRGSHPTDINYGTDMRAWLGSNFTQQELYVFETLIKSEVVKERRVLGCEVKITVLRDLHTGSFQVKLKILTEEEPFSLLLTVSPDGGEDPEGSVSAAVNNITPYVWTVTETPTAVMLANVNRKGFFIHNTSPSVPVYYAWGKAPTTASMTWPGNQQRQIEPVLTKSLYLMCPAGMTAIVKAEESY